MTLGFAFIGAGLKTEYNQTVNSDSCNEVNSGSSSWLYVHVHQHFMIQILQLHRQLKLV